MDSGNEPSIVFRPRQTINALLIQLRDDGLPQQQLREVQKLHQSSIPLFAGLFRGTGKPFDCHLVGTASVVGRFTGDSRQVGTALFHAAYDFASFPDGTFGGATPAHRAYLRRIIGTDVEDMVWRFSRFDFEESDIDRLLQAPAAADRDALFLRLCNEVDDLVDGGLAFARKRGEQTLPLATKCRQLAARIGEPELGQLIMDLARENDSLTWATELATEPYSYRTMLPVRSYARLAYKRLRKKRVVVVPR